MLMPDAKKHHTYGFGELTQELYFLPKVDLNKDTGGLGKKGKPELLTKTGSDSKKGHG